MIRQGITLNQYPWQQQVYLNIPTKLAILLVQIGFAAKTFFCEKGSSATLVKLDRTYAKKPGLYEKSLRKETRDIRINPVSDLVVRKSWLERVGEKKTTGKAKTNFDAFNNQTVMEAFSKTKLL